MESQIIKRLKLVSLGLSTASQLPSAYVDTPFEHYGNSQYDFNKYDKIIYDIKKMHDSGTINKDYKYQFDEDTRKAISVYIENNKEKISIITEDYASHNTTSNYCSRRLVLSLIIGEPYYEFVPSERDTHYTIKVEF